MSSNLFSTVREGNTEQLTEILRDPENKRHVNNPRDYNDTLLHVAADGGNPDVCRLLTGAGARCDIVDALKHTPIHRAAVRGHSKAVQRLLSDGGLAVIDWKDSSGWTALHFAIRKGSLETVRVLVRNGANLALKNNQGQTATDLARQAKQWDIYTFLEKRNNVQDDRIYRAINQYSEQIIEAYHHVMSTVGWSDTRMRMVLLGDKASGKTSLGKTLFDRGFQATSPVVTINMSIGEIGYKQFQDWKMATSHETFTEKLQVATEDFITVSIFNHIREKKRKENQKEAPQRPFSPETRISSDKTSPNLMMSGQSASSGERLLSSPSPIQEVISDYIIIEENPSPSPPVTPTVNDGADSLSDKRPKTYCVTDPNKTFNISLLKCLPRSQLNNIFKWWPLRNKPLQLPAFSRETSAPLRTDSCLMSLSEISGEPLLITLLPLIFSQSHIFLLALDTSTDLNDTCKSWLSAGIINCDLNPLTGIEVAAEWIATVTATASPSNELQFPFHFEPHHPQLPVILLLGSKVDEAQSSLQCICEPLQELVPKAKYHIFQEKNKDRANADLLPIPVSSLDERKRLHFSTRNFDIVRRQLDLQVCRNFYHFAHFIPLAFNKIYIFMSQLQQKSPKLSFIVVDLLLELLYKDEVIAVDKTVLEVALRYLHSTGLVLYFYRHPQLRNLVFLHPQSLLESLATLLREPSKLLDEDFRSKYNACKMSGCFPKLLLSLLYEIDRPTLDFNVAMYLFDAMNILCSHPQLNSKHPHFIIPSLVQTPTPDRGFFPCPARADGEVEWLTFTRDGMPFPWAAYNQLVTSICRSNIAFLPVLWQAKSHFQLTNYTHLLLVLDSKSVTFRVEKFTDSITCKDCRKVELEDKVVESSEPVISTTCLQCGQPLHTETPAYSRDSPGILCQNCGSVMSNYDIKCNDRVVFIEWKKSIKTDLPNNKVPDFLSKMFKSSVPHVQSVRPLMFPLQTDSLKDICPVVLSFLQDQLSCITDCWFPGLKFCLKTLHWNKGITIDHRWMLENLSSSSVPNILKLWWK